MHICTHLYIYIQIYIHSYTCIKYLSMRRLIKPCWFVAPAGNLTRRLRRLSALRIWFRVSSLFCLKLNCFAGDHNAFRTLFIFLGAVLEDESLRGAFWTMGGRRVWVRRNGKTETDDCWAGTADETVCSEFPWQQFKNSENVLLPISSSLSLFCY